jgi:hypothetical protein
MTFLIIRQKNIKNLPEVLRRMWGNKHTPTLLVEISTGSTTLESNLSKCCEKTKCDDVI